MKSVSLSMAETNADRNNNNNENGNSVRMSRSYDLRYSGNGSDRLPYRYATYVRNFSSSAGCIVANGSGYGDDKEATKPIRWV